MNKNPIISNEYLQELARDIMLELSPEELTSIRTIEKDLKAKFAAVLKINTDNVEPLNYPFEEPHLKLRDDAVVKTIPQATVLQNAPVTQDEFIVLTKVIK
ncbi:aspartyl/glutamyl-tRNA(Asn/Gln) amidotransferase subunit C [Entomoplasma freundtii]|uniref:Aspartyl/glutamyl-tRNA amidotransferase subunit C n=1 Tax=Entomoplasma freundtii TaxID=74700 RepID=A0A2K8NRZ9_9MOLU|nr:glutamyl-tRNA amidotransferase [Entomoplasma freundtii]ATZ16625.1 aspartyl/glutamyl-tRNA amidotransferase subunit C [Entomoplasma freundtii]TDY58208.1 aspartyl/glutamyl-tRNA(Asn/Gln) amidotransferase subunit C [Entomoplasma freundtii]